MKRILVSKWRLKWTKSLYECRRFDMHERPPPAPPTSNTLGEGGGITARLRFKAQWLENCVRQDCDISHSE